MCCEKAKNLFFMTAWTMTKEKEICFETLLLKNRHGVAFQNTSTFIVTLETKLKLQFLFLLTF